jgi:hypothetical protein
MYEGDRSPIRESPLATFATFAAPVERVSSGVIMRHLIWPTLAVLLVAWAVLTN